MIILRVKERGHYISIPGTSPVNSPVEMDITRLSLPLVATHLKNAGIENYQIIAESKTGKSTIYTKEDFFPKKKKKTDSLLKYKNEINKKFSRLEDLILSLIKTEPKSEDGEQITDRLDSIEKLILDNRIKEVIYTSDHKKKDGEPDIEELDDFIPEVDIGDMKMKGTSSTKTESKDEDVDQAADALSQFTKSKWRKKS